MKLGPHGIVSKFWIEASGHVACRHDIRVPGEFGCDSDLMAIEYTRRNLQIMSSTLRHCFCKLCKGLVQLTGKQKNRHEGTYGMYDCYESNMASSDDNSASESEFPPLKENEEDSPCVNIPINCLDYSLITLHEGIKSCMGVFLWSILLKKFVFKNC